MKNMNKLLTLLLLLTSSIAMMAQDAVKGQKDQFFPSSSKSKEANQAFREALVFLWNARTPEYIAKSDEALRLDPQFFLANANRAIAEATFGEKNKSKDFIQKTLELPQDNLTPAERILRRLVVALKDDKPDEMKKQADEMIRTYPNSTQSYSLAIAVARNFTNNTDDIYGYAKRLLEIDPDNGPTWNQLGYYHLEKGELAQAKVAFDNYLRLNPNEANAHDSMGDYYLAANNADKAAEHFDKAASMGMTSSRERAEKARQLAQNASSDRPKVKPGVEQQTDAAGHNADIHGKPDRPLPKAGMEQQSSTNVPQSGANGNQNTFLPVSSTSQTAINTLHHAVDRVNHADVPSYKSKLNQAITEDPQFFLAQAYIALSDVMEGQENKEKDNSKASIEKALSIPQQGFTPAEQIIREMLVSLQGNNIKDVKPLCDKLIQQYPQSTEAFMLAGDISRFILDDNEVAFSYFNQLTKANPNFGPAWNQIGYYHLEKGDLAQAKTAFDNYLRINPNEANAHDSMGDYCLAAKKYDQAAMHFEKAVAMGMDVSRERAEKARALAESGAGEPDDEK